MKLLLITFKVLPLMSLVDNINITKNICLHHGEGQINNKLSYEYVENLVLNYIEGSTGCTLFNKSNMLSELKTIFDNPSNNLIKELSNIINKNIIPQISFEKLFKSDLDFAFVFNQDEIVIFYQNKKVELKSINEIKKKLLENNLNSLPVITELFVNNIGNIIEKLIEKDMSVKYNLINIPLPYWKLFEIKSKRINKKFITDQYLEDIISGKNYQIKSNSDSEDELKAALIQIEELEKSKIDNKLSDQQKKELDSHYRMEVMSYLNDEEMDYFLEKMEYIDDQEKNIDIENKKNITMYVGQLLNIVNNSNNKMIKYYTVFKMFTFLLKCGNFLEQHENFRNIVHKKVNQLLEDIVIFESSGLELSKELSSILYEMKDIIEKINIQYGQHESDSESDDYYPQN